MTQLAPMPTRAETWIQGICRRFSQATGWPLRFETNLFPVDFPSFHETDAPPPLWRKDLKNDEATTGRLILDRPAEDLIESELPRILALTELIAELISQHEFAQSELESRSHELATLVDIGRMLPGGDDLPSILSRLVQAVVQLTGFRSSAFFLLNPEGDTLFLRAEHHQEFREVPFPKRDALSDAPDFQTLRSDRKIVSADGSPLDAIWLPSGVAMGAVLPVLLDGEPLGTLWAYDRRAREPEQREWHVLESIAAQISSAFERTVLHHESSTEHRLRLDCRVASDQQDQSLFAKLPEDIGFKFAGFCTSRYELGGDVCEAISIDEHRTVIILGDACGDSVPAAMVMSAIRGAVHSLMASCSEDVFDTERMMERLNRTLHAVTPPHQFMSLIYLVIDTEHQTISYTNAGHPAPILLHQGEVRELESHGVLAGILAETDYGASTYSFAADDLLVLFTDGITEAMSDRCTLFRSRGIVDTVIDHQHQSAAEVLGAITERLKAHTGGEPDDDRTLVVIRFS